METVENIEVIAFEIILHSGNARSLIHDALKKVRGYDFEDFEKIIAEAEGELLLAHRAQTKLLQDFAGGFKFTLDILMVHAQDHLMTTMLLKENAFEFCEIYKVLNNKK